MPRCFVSFVSQSFATFLIHQFKGAAKRKEKKTRKEEHRESNNGHENKPTITCERQSRRHGRCSYAVRVESDIETMTARDWLSCCTPRTASLRHDELGECSGLPAHHQTNLWQFHSFGFKIKLQPPALPCNA